ACAGRAAVRPSHARPPPPSRAPHAPRRACTPPRRAPPGGTRSPRGRRSAGRRPHVSPPAPFPLPAALREHRTARTITAMRSARLAHRALPPAAALAVALALSASSSAASVTLTNVHLTGGWKEGWLTAKIHFTVNANGATAVQATVRPVKPGPVAKVQHYTFARAGSKGEMIPLPARLKPGDYVLKVGGATSKFSVPSPPEGIVDRATISLAKGGSAAKTVPATSHSLWVRFHFLAPPANAKTVKIEWRTPSFQFIGAVTKPYAATIDSNLPSGGALPQGTWDAMALGNGKVAKRQDVRVT